MSSSQNDELVSTNIFPERIEKNKVDDVQSNASSTDDYVRELLDPDDRPRNVWHVVEGPKAQLDNESESGENNNGASPSNGCLPLHNSENSVQSKEEGGFEPADRSEIGSDIGTGSDCKQNVDVVIDEQEGKRKDEKKSHHRVEEKSSRKRDRSRERSSSSRRHRHHSRSDRDHHDSDRDRHRSKRKYDFSDDECEDDYDRRRSHKDRRHSRSKSKTSSTRRERSRSDSQSPITKRNSRTILIMQLNPRVTSRDLEDFFSDIGRVREVRLIMDSKTRRHKGIAYIEFEEASSAAKAFSLNGQKFFGAPVVIQSAQMDRNRPSSDWHTSTSLSINHPSSHSSSRSHLPPDCYRVYVGGLHVNLTEEMIRSVFEPFGPIVRLELMKDRATNVSRGYAFITYAKTDEGQKAVQALDGFELGGKALRVSKSTDKSERYPNNETTSSSVSRGAHRHDSDSDGRSSKSKDISVSLYELAGH